MTHLQEKLPLNLIMFNFKLFQLKNSHLFIFNFIVHSFFLFKIILIKQFGHFYSFWGKIRGRTVHGCYAYGKQGKNLKVRDSFSTGKYQRKIREIRRFFNRL